MAPEKKSLNLRVLTTQMSQNDVFLKLELGENILSFQVRYDGDDRIA